MPATGYKYIKDASSFTYIKPSGWGIYETRIKFSNLRAHQISTLHMLYKNLKSTQNILPMWKFKSS